MVDKQDKYYGKQYGQYRIDKKLGEGRYGICYLAYSSDRKQVILKKFRTSCLGNVKNRNVSEAVILSRLNHPSIPQLLGIVNTNRFYAYVLEYKPGETIEAKLYEQQNKFSDDEIFSIGSKLIRILVYLHQAGVVHRDIRVLIHDEEIFLLDFGLAQWMCEGSYHTSEDFAYLGDFLLHLLYSTFIRKKGQNSAPWYEELELSEPKKLFLKRLLKIEKTFDSIFDLETDFCQIFR
jgi:serine/threonine protein kinase